jgi:hypothetical protein
MIIDRKLVQKLIQFSLSLCLILVGVELIDRLYIDPVYAQTLNPDEVANVVYQRLPNIPQENQYFERESETVAKNNTLVSRLVRYHQYIKSRPTNFRIDWQLTLADYLGVNETMQEKRYPGSSTLTVNPLDSDRQVIIKLTRQQRLELIDVLVGIYNNSN